MGERCPHSPLQTTGWLTGWRLTFGGEEHGWDGALATIVQDPFEQVFVAVYDVTPRGREPAGRLGVRRLRALPQDQGPGLHARRRDRRLGLRPRRLRGWSSLGVLPRGARRRRRGGRRPRRLRRGAARTAVSIHRPVEPCLPLGCPRDRRPRRTTWPPRPPPPWRGSPGWSSHDVALVLGSGWLPAVDAPGRGHRGDRDHGPARVLRRRGRRALGQDPLDQGRVTATCWSSSAAPTTTRARASRRSSTGSVRRPPRAAGRSC